MSCGRRCARRACARRARRARPTAAQGACAIGRSIDWTGFYIGAHAGYSRGSSIAVLTDPAVAAPSNLFSGLDRRRAGRLQCSAALRAPARRRSRHLRFRIICTRTRWCPRLATRALRRHRADGIMSAPRAAASAMPHGHWLLTPPAGWPLPASAFSTRPTVGNDEKHINVRLGWAAGARRRIRLRAALERAAGISLQPVRAAPTSASRQARNTVRPSISSRSASASTARSTGRASSNWTPKTASDRSGIRSLGNPRPDDLSAAGLSGVPRALYRHQQPDAGAAGPGDLEQQSVFERAALGGRRGLLQSRTAAGIWIERHRRRRRLSQRRSAEIRTSPTRITTPRGCSCVRPLVSAASRKSSPARRANSPTRSMSRA